MKIIDDEFTKLKDDIDKLQKSPTLYVSYRGREGVEQLLHELTNNMIDEHRNPNSISDGKMIVDYNTLKNVCRCTDTGRGINFHDLEDACTILQAGTKMDRESSGGSGGEYGVGLTATNALSEEFEIASTRNGQRRYLRFRNGRKVQDDTTTIKDKKKHGLSVSFKPSFVFLGEDAVLPVENFKKWLSRIIHTLDNTVQITFLVTDDEYDENVIDKVVYENKTGTLEEFIPDIVGDIGYLLAKPILIKNRMTLIEDGIPTKVTDKNGVTTIEVTSMERFIEVEAAINYSPKSTETLVFGFTNTIEQSDGGVHMNALKNTLSGFILEKVQDTMKKNNSLEVIQDDALTGLVAVISLNTNMSTGFASQTKHKLGNKKFISPIKKLLSESIEKYFEGNAKSQELRKIIELIKVNAKIRMDASNKRKKIKTSNLTVMGSNLIGLYVPANSIGVSKDELKVPLEIYFGEGTSAGGQLRKARFNPDYQGILNFTGNPTNIYDKYKNTKHIVLPESNVFSIIYDKVLCCGYGSHFDMDSLIYDKLIYAFDADVDGNHMAGLNLAATWRLAPRLILEGHCYRAISPLYKVAESQAAANKMSQTDIDVKDYVYSKAELFDRFEDNVVIHARIKFHQNEDFISNSNMKRFLQTNREYYKLLDVTSQFESVPKGIIEFMAANPDYESHIEDLDEELHCVDGIVSGCYKGQPVAVPATANFLETIEKLRIIIQQGNDGIYQYEFYDRPRAKANFRYVDRMTIGEIMEICQKYSPYLVSRYKGLGEMSKYEMWKLVMHPCYRRLARYTVSDVESFQSTLDDLFLSDEPRRQIRKQMVQTANITLDDIDN